MPISAIKSVLFLIFILQKKSIHYNVQKMNTNFRRKNVLIIGSNGLIGRSLTNYLREKITQFLR